MLVGVLFPVSFSKFDIENGDECGFSSLSVDPIDSTSISSHEELPEAEWAEPEQAEPDE